jgi:hypothetical protein
VSLERETWNLSVVIGRRFAWAHLPKTGGDATQAMLTAVPGLVLFADPPEAEDKHTPFFAREDQVTGKLLVMNIRRLPAWTLSAAHHRAAHGVYPDYRPLPLQTAEEMAAQTDPDDLLRWMTDHDRLPVARWLRAESLEDDVLSLLDELGQLTSRTARRVRAVGRVNEGNYAREPAAWFTAEQVSRLYARNPVWAAVERRLYGDTLPD